MRVSTLLGSWKKKPSKRHYGLYRKNQRVLKNKEKNSSNYLVLLESCKYPDWICLPVLKFREDCSLFPGNEDLWPSLRNFVVVIQVNDCKLDEGNQEIFFLMEESLDPSGRKTENCTTLILSMKITPREAADIVWFWSEFLTIGFFDSYGFPRAKYVKGRCIVKPIMIGQRPMPLILMGNVVSSISLTLMCFPQPYQCSIDENLVTQ